MVAARSGAADRIDRPRHHGVDSDVVGGAVPWPAPGSAPTMPAFAVTAWTRPTAPTCAEMPPRLTIEPPPAACDVRCGGMGAVERAIQRGAHDFAAIPPASCRLNLVCRRTEALLTSTSSRPKSADRRLNQAPRLRRIGDVGHMHRRLGARLAHQSGGFLRVVFGLPGGDQDAKTVPRQVHRDRPPIFIALPVTTAHFRSARSISSTLRTDLSEPSALRRSRDWTGKARLVCKWTAQAAWWQCTGNRRKPWHKPHRPHRATASATPSPR